ncbi:MAG: cell surface protein SprA [Alphaproteobacteria bacterium]|nr:cell surface protein SprA [Alphaproteobacteria bacterium]
MRNFLFYKLFLLLFIGNFNILVIGQNSSTQSNTKKKNIIYKHDIKDRYAPKFELGNKNAFNIQDTNLIKEDIFYDPYKKNFYVQERIGSRIYRQPFLYNQNEFYQKYNKQKEAEYFQLRANILNKLNKKVKRPEFVIDESFYASPLFFNNDESNFGKLGNTLNDAKQQVKNAKKGVDDLKNVDGVKLDFQLLGDVSITMGYLGSKSYNPNLAPNQRNVESFDFKPNYNLNANVKLGDNFKLPFNFTNLNELALDNQVKLSFKGRKNQIIKSIDAGNINFQTKSTLIPSTQNLFGIKSRLQFGKLYVTGVIATQNSNKDALSLKGGSSVQKFSKKIDDYDENKHFLLGQYFKQHFSEVMGHLPQPNSQVNIQRIEVWVTNRNNNTNDVRFVTAFSDLGETNPYSNLLSSNNSNFPDNNANNLFSKLLANKSLRDPTDVSTQLQAMGFKSVQDFEKVYARKLTTSEYYFNQQAGFISLNIQLLPDDVLGVAYQFSYNGKTYQVGEFSTDVNPDTTNGNQQVIFLKMLRATSPRVDLPIWDLMMKNVYSLDFSGNIERTDFQLNLYYSDPGAGLKRYLPVSDASASGKTLLRLLNLDNLNSTNNPQPDGIFDFVEGYTILLNRGKIIFPYLEPFGKDLETVAFQSQTQEVRNKFLFYQLYDSLKFFAQNSNQVNRFIIEGQAKGVSGEFTINAFNIPQGSVSIQVGGYKLIEGQDFVIDYGSGRGRIINPAYINNASTAVVTFENSAGISTQQKNFSALRLDYVENDNLTFGFTAVGLGGTPFFSKLNYGDDPVKNAVYGLDVSYRGQSEYITSLVNKVLPVKSKAPSFFTSYVEVAYFKPSHPSSIGTSGTIYIDDFESAGSSIDLKDPSNAWVMSSVPQGQSNLFPEASLNNDLSSNYNRAKLAWYKILPLLQQPNTATTTSSNINPLRNNFAELNDPRVRRVLRSEIYPGVTQFDNIALFQTFDLAYYPMLPGPYNFQLNPSFINQNGRLLNPQNSWAGIMRAIDQTDFETNNIEYIEFWMLDPFIKFPRNGGKLYLNIGSISEDVLQDGKRMFEQGLPTPNLLNFIDSTVWGYQPQNPIQIINTFSNEPTDRIYQDLGFDGMNKAVELRFRQDQINQCRLNFGENSAIYTRYLQDPSQDDYEWYLDDKFTSTDGILRRYINFNNMENNSPVVSGGSNILPQATIYPDVEDLNKDNTLNQNESYYQYEIPIEPGMNTSNSPYIYNTKVSPVFNVDDTTAYHFETWYQFRIPIRNFTTKIGEIRDFKSIRFLRLFLKDFNDTIVMRFGTLNLLRNNWRPYTYNLDTNGSLTESNNNPFSVGVVNLFEHQAKTPVGYLVPPGILQQQITTASNSLATLNEQAISLRIDDLPYKNNKAVFKSVNLDLRRYKKLQMFIHAESKDDIRRVNLQDNEVEAVIRIGQDAVNNFYEIRLPLKVTAPGYYSDIAGASIVWPTVNNLDLVLQDLINLKLKRNTSRFPQNQIYRLKNGNTTLSVIGNPNIAEVYTILMGIENVSARSISAEIWFNELRLTDFVEDGSWAGLARLDATLADVGTVNFSFNGRQAGFGSVDQNINNRSLDNQYQIDFATNLELGKFLPKQVKMSLPLAFSVQNTTLQPKYDPLDKDVLAQDKINSSDNPDSVRSLIEDQTTAINVALNNIRVLSNSPKKPIYSLTNFDVSYSYAQINHTNATIARDYLEKHVVSFGYTYAVTPKYIQPFKKLIPQKMKAFALFHELNFNFIPSNITYRINMNRQYGEFVPRIINSFGGDVERVDTTYNKFFTVDQSFNLKFNLTKSITLDFTSSAKSLIDEPEGRINSRIKTDSLLKNLVKLGRTTLYNQRFNARYNLPLKYIPFLFWVNANYTYSANFEWLGASANALDLGHTLSNDNQQAVNTQFNFEQLYGKSKYLKKVISNTPSASGSKVIHQLPKPIISKDSALKGLKGRARDSALVVWKKDYQIYKSEVRRVKSEQRDANGISYFSRAIGGFITMFRTFTLDYSQRYVSRVPGYLGRSSLFNNNFDGFSSIAGYAFGATPTTNWLNQRALEGFYTRSLNFNLQITQSYTQNLNLRLLVEPIRHLTINLTLDRSLTKDYSELFKDTAGLGIYNHLSPLSKGSFKMSYTFLNTSKISQPIGNVSQLFRIFETNRRIVAERVAALNPYWQRLPQVSKYTAEGFPTGYNKFAQEVLIPSFLAAYSGESPESVPLLQTGSNSLEFNPFGKFIPFPNWQINYSGLSQIPAIKKIFNTISFKNAYISTLEMGAFTSALLYDDPFNYGGPGFIDTVTGNYVPYFVVPNLTISERFEPFFGIDLTTKQFSFRFEYKKSRIFTLSLIDYQVSEGVTSEYVFGSSYQIRGLALGVTKLLGTLKSDLVVRIDVSMRDSKRANSRLEQNSTIGVEGQNDILISPSVDFIINGNFNVKFFFEQRRLTPYVSNNYPTVNTRAGITLRYSFR